jgi:hypothetical protein
LLITSQIIEFLQSNSKITIIYAASCLIIYLAAKQDFLKQNAIARQEFSFLSTFSPQYWANSSDISRSSRIYAIGLVVFFVLIASTGNFALFKMAPEESTATPALAVAVSMLFLISNPVNPYKIVQDSWRKAMYDYALIPAKIDDLRRELSARQFDYNTISLPARRALFPMFSTSELTGIDANATPAIWKRVRLGTILYILRNAPRTLNSQALSLSTFTEKLDLITDNLRAIVSDVGEAKIARGQKARSIAGHNFLAADGAYETRLLKHEDKLEACLLHAELLLACAIATREVDLTEQKVFATVGFQDTPISATMPATQSSWVAVSFVLSFILAFALLAISLRYSYTLPSPATWLGWPLKDDFTSNLFSSVHYTYIPIAAALYFALRARNPLHLHANQWVMPTIVRAAFASYLSMTVVKAVQIVLTQTVRFGGNLACGPVNEGGAYQLHCIVLGNLPFQLLTVALSVLCALAVVAILNAPLSVSEKSTYKKSLSSHLRYISIILGLSLFHLLSGIVLEGMLESDYGLAAVRWFCFLLFLLSFYYWMASSALQFQQSQATSSSATGLPSVAT